MSLFIDARLNSGSGIGTNRDGSSASQAILVDTYSLLPSAAAVPNQYYKVEIATGFWPSKKDTGVYKSNGTTWLYLGSQDDAEIQANIELARTAPYTDALNPFGLGPLSSKTFSVTGGNFDQNTTVEFVPSIGLTLNSQTLINSGEIQINVTSDATIQPYNVIFKNGSVPSANVVTITVSPLTTLIPGSLAAPWLSVAANTGVGVGFIETSGISAVSWNKGAYAEQCPALTNCTMQWTYRSSGNLDAGTPLGMAGLGIPPSSTIHYADISFAVYTYNTGVKIYESGVQIHNAAFAPVDLDVFKITRVGTVITYFRNGVAFYTSLTVSGTALDMDFSLYRNIGYENITLEYG